MIAPGPAIARLAAIRMVGFSLAAGVSCTSPDDGGDRAIARAYDHLLLWSDLRQVVPLEMNAADSAELAQRFVQGWLRQQVLLHLAESNLNAEGADLEGQLEDYRRSLVIFNYEQALVDQKLDTAITDAEIVQYYEAHKANFELKDDLIRARWFNVNEPDKRVLRKMEERFLGGKGEQMRELEIWLAQLGVSITDRSGTWIPSADLRAEVPMNDTEAREMIARNGKRVFKATQGAWFVEILEHRDRNSESPVDLVRQDIRSILLNQRKLELIEGIRESAFQQALEHAEVEQMVH